MEQKPKWLTRIQENSWEPELFISGGAIFSLLELTDWIQRSSLINFQQGGFYETLLIANFVMAAVNALIFGFILHLVARGFWMAAVCLSFVFPGRVEGQHLAFAEIFKKKLSRLYDSEELVVLLEKASSIIFFLAFFFFFLIISTFLVFMVLMPHSALRAPLGEQGFLVLRIVSYVGFCLAGMYAIDFLTLGFFKKQAWMSRFYYPVYWVFSLITLAFVYRSAYYTLAYNIRKSTLWLIIVLFMSAAWGGSLIRYGRLYLPLNPQEQDFFNVKSENLKYDVSYYEDERPEKELVQHLSIQSAQVSEKHLRLFIVHQKVVERSMSLPPSRSSHKSMESFLRKPEHLQYFSKFYKVMIDNEAVENLQWRQYEHPKTGELGIIAFVPIHKYSSEIAHTLFVYLDIEEEAKKAALQSFGLKHNLYAQIPFWKN